MALQLNMEALQTFGVTMKGKLDQYMADRAGLEQQWLKNLRQYRGKYDPEDEKLISSDKSHVYPRDTRTKVKAFVAKMMELMFPATEFNWELETTPIPSIQKKDLDAIIAALQQQEMQMAEQEQRPPMPVTADDIEEAIQGFSKIRMGNMERKIRDQLADEGVDFPQLCKRVLRSGAIYGAGVLMSPMVRAQKERVFEHGAGGWEAAEKTLKRPYPEFVKIWDIYPDLSAWTWEEQEGLWHRMVFTRHNLRMLAKKPGFIKENISNYLRDHTIGNYVQRSYEAGLNEMNYEVKVMNRDERKYEVFRWYGYVSAHDLSKLGMEVKEADMDKDLLVDFWMIDNTIIKAIAAPFGDSPSDVYHAFIYTEDEDSGLTGSGMPEELRDSQMSLCAATRALYDNMAATAGPMLEVAVDLMKRGSDYNSIHSFKVFEREGEGPELAYPAVRPISHPSHIPDISNIIAQARQQFDSESNMPSWMQGNPEQLGEAFRTSRNMSMLAGGGNMIPKDNVRAFDRFTASVIGSFLKWNQEFDKDEETMGDFGVRPKGSISLVAKEVRGAALDQMMSQMSEEERAMLKIREILLERFKARDLDVELIMDPDEAAAALQGLREAQAAEHQAAAEKDQADTQVKTATAGKLQADTQKAMADTEATQAGTEATQATTEVKILEILANIENMEKNTDLNERKQQLDTVKSMLETLAAKETAGSGYEG